MANADEPVHHLMHDNDTDDALRAPTAPRVTPEPAPADTVLIVTGVAAGVVGTLVTLAGWRMLRNRRR